MIHVAIPETLIKLLESCWIESKPEMNGMLILDLKRILV